MHVRGGYGPIAHIPNISNYFIDGNTRLYIAGNGVVLTVLCLDVGPQVRFESEPESEMATSVLSISNRQRDDIFYRICDSTRSSTTKQKNTADHFHRICYRKTETA